MLIRYLLCVFFACLTLAGCATSKSSNTKKYQVENFVTSAASCHQWFNQLDRIVDRDGARDFGPAMVEDYPFLRVNRFLASFGDSIEANEASYNRWITSMSMLNQESREIEILNLSERVVAMFGVGRDELQNITNKCSIHLTQALIERQNAEMVRLRSRAVVPDEYNRLKQVVGLYSLLQFPFSEGISDWHEEAQSTFDRYEIGNPDGLPRVRYTADSKGRLSLLEVKKLISKRDALGQLILQSDDIYKLFRTYAPSFTVEDTGDFDRIGAVKFSDSQDVVIDANLATVYTHLAYTRFEGKTLPQLVYVVWFSARPKSGWIDLLGGHLDGIIWRVTLDHDGVPLIYDSIHSCGCYHMFFPSERLEPIAPPSRRIEWSFSPKQLQSNLDNLVIDLTVQSKSHYLASVTMGAGDPVDDNKRYVMQSYNRLRSLESDRGQKNLFGYEGIVKGTQRNERFILWPSGIRSPGAMRQWGRHATAFVGRRHFDGARLFERYYQRR